MEVSPASGSTSSFLSTDTVKYIKSSLTTGLDRPSEFQEVEAPRFQDNRHIEDGMVVSPTDRPPLPPGNIPGTHFY